MMDMNKIYRLLAAISASLGVGLFLGHSIGEGTSNTPLWLAGLSILAGGVLIGMSLAGSGPTKAPAHKPEQPEE